MKIDELGLSARAYHVLQNAKINTVEQLREALSNPFVKVGSIGSSVFNEIQEKLAAHTLTNGDRIRAMTDYELAEFMSGKIVDQRFLCDSENGNELSIGEQMAVRHNHFCTWNKWLKQPAEEVT